MREASRHRAAKWIKLFPTSTFSLFAIDNQGNPKGYSAERGGLGPLWLAQTARVQVLHEGAKTWKWKWPAGIADTKSSWRSESNKS